ncbi:MAG: hypothetical protein FD153_1154 [Rhodospirillaceae bacterium]|nr:MAG: hypothetical protein FD153_1154 [Rhodospirillaceae bacterium]
MSCLGLAESAQLLFDPPGDGREQGRTAVLAKEFLELDGRLLARPGVTNRTGLSFLSRSMNTVTEVWPCRGLV